MKEFQVKIKNKKSLDCFGAYLLFCEENKMKNVFLIITIIFIIFTFCGAAYVILKKGTVNAGYACVPMLFSLIFLKLYQSKK